MACALRLSSRRSGSTDSDYHRPDRRSGSAGMDSCPPDRMKKRPQPFHQRRRKRAVIVDLPIQRHQRLNCLKLRIVRIYLSPLPHQLIAEVFDGMAEFFQRTSRIRRNAPPPALPQWNTLRPGKFSKMKSGGCNRCHIPNSFPANLLRLMLYIGGCQFDL
jgi:hypothetical protein